MKKLCRENVYIFLGNEDWEKVWNGRLKYIDMDNLKTKHEAIFHDFDHAYAYLSDHTMYSASAWHTMFRKPCINYCRGELFDYPAEVITKKNLSHLERNIFGKRTVNSIHLQHYQKNYKQMNLLSTVKIMEWLFAL